jgi:hypothetical protein
MFGKRRVGMTFLAEARMVGGEAIGVYEGCGGGGSRWAGGRLRRDGGAGID